ncbi:hypothetical protein NBRGN_069_00110 [Nocardia brasiliensis NBRC 14402]|uniref:hypothetical protein n=1 Tax=Nocardia brasiliensis TaxID=37326 RepID=UPI0002FA179B|nr:hypothetical protein [Nocardia brasiliensis]ASF06422.1 hypothetical protein CEQ30_02680 [Nocardia brasiliensis]GAJ84179.1 hypothetical protein NBRGN_069_00110 [Nocardia brasiliensis NBRC 14402]SUB55680.1 Uncharacterised protein [Nocardia brasiliensis]
MKPLDTGVIAPEEHAMAHAADQNVAIGQQAVLDSVQNAPQAVLDVSLPQLPEDLPPIEPPEFVLAKKISEDQHNAMGTGLPGMPGLSGAPTADANGISGVPSDVSALLGDTGTAIQQAAAPIAQGVLDQAQGVLNGALGSSPSSVAAAVSQAQAAIPTSLPALPADPVGALMQGVAVPALPGVDLLMQPILSLLNSFGSGVIGALDPTAILSQSSKVIDMAMSVGKGSMTTVEQLWQSQAARNAQAASAKANVEGQETSQRGIDISELTQRAAAVVQQGNAQLLGIASSFATQATAMAPVILTPPAQATLMASATEHLGQAVGVVNATRGDLAGKTGELSGMVQQLVAPGGGPAPQEVAQALAQNVGQPILEQAQSTASDTMTKAAGVDSSLTGTPSSTTPSSVHNSGTPSSTHSGLGTGVPSSLSRSGSPGTSARPGTTGIPSSPKLTAVPGTSLPGGRPISGIPGTTFGPGTTGAPSTTTAGAGNSFMGGPAAAGAQRGDDDEHNRTVQPYQSAAGNDDLTGPLGESTPDVIGATHSDEIISSDYEQDQF